MWACSSFAGGAAGSILSGGLGSLLNQLQQNGHGEAASSWVGTGENKDISPGDLAKAIGSDELYASLAHPHFQFRSVTVTHDAETLAAIERSKVVLPQPDDPRMAMNSPSATSRSTPCKMVEAP